MSEEIKVGSIVETDYNSGIYIGKIIEDRGNSWLIEVQAISKHPTQGDLHNPEQTEGVAFHERKALGPREKLNGRKRKTYLYSSDVPNYVDSLKDSYAKLTSELEARNDNYGKLALDRLADLDAAFYQKIYNK